MTAQAILPIDGGARPELARWTGAAAAVLIIHAGIILSYSLYSHPLAPQGDAEVPAIVIDLAPLTVAPTIQHQDLAFGPESLPTPPIVEEPKAEAKPDRDPKVEPTPLDNSLVTLPEPKPQVRPEEKPKQPPPQQQTAPPKAEHVASVPAVARIGANSSNVLPPVWISQLLAHLNRHKRYPSTARVRHEEGVVTLSFTMDHDGHVLGRNIAKGSGSQILDDEALAMLRRSEPLPALPPNAAGASRSFSVPIRFSFR